MKKEPPLKQLTMAFAIILAVVLYSTSFINWRDALLIMALPIALWHLLSLFIWKVSKPEPEYKQPVQLKKETYDIEKLVWFHEVDQTEIEMMREPPTREDLRRWAANEFCKQLPQFIRMYERSPDPEYRNPVYSFELWLCNPKITNKAGDRELNDK